MITHSFVTNLSLLSHPALRTIQLRHFVINFPNINSQLRRTTPLELPYARANIGKKKQNKLYTTQKSMREFQLITLSIAIFEACEAFN